VIDEPFFKTAAPLNSVSNAAEKYATRTYFQAKVSIYDTFSFVIV
jgi:hypothetical protein